MTPLLLTLVLVMALVMAYINGLHDASNAVSTTIATRTLRESTALVMAALLNLLGALLGLALITVTAQWAVELLGMAPLTAATAENPDRLGLALLAIMLATIGWDLLTWWLGMPASTWHAFIGATLGVTLVIGAAAAWEQLGILLLVSLVGPVLSAGLAFALMHGLLRAARHERVRRGHLRFAQTLSAGAVATGHGINDSRLPLAVVVVAAAAGLSDGDPARVVSRRGAVEAVVLCDEDMRTDTVFLPFHFGGDGRANRLTLPELDPTSRMPEFKVCAVRLEAL